MAERKKSMNQYRIRAHHGMCLAFFEGKGYSGGFTRHMGFMKQELEKNPTVCLVKETDDICRECPNNQNGICETQKKVKGYDDKVFALCGLTPGVQIRWKDFSQLVSEKILKTGERSRICGDCQWNDICGRA